MEQAGTIGAAWYVLQVEPARDYRCRDGLRLSGFEVFLPSVEHSRRRGRTVIRMREPLLPCYQFVRLDLGDRAAWQAVVQSAYAIGLLCYGRDPRRPAPIACGLVERLREDAGAAELIRAPAWQKGDRLRITAGPYEGLAGIYQRCARERITLMLDMLGRSVRVTLSDRLVASAV